RMGLGDNTKALLMTRGMTEMARLGVALGGRKETFAGLSGMGDLIVTCTSMHSRNRRCGILIGQGKKVREAMDQVGATVEGYFAALSAHQLSERSEEHTSELQSRFDLVCRLLLEKKNKDILRIFLIQSSTSVVTSVLMCT